MKVSGRVTNSFYCFLNQNHFDTSCFYELSTLEMHFIRDPYVWMDINTVEHFIQQVSGEFSRHFVQEEFTKAVGHASLKLEAWGDLDSVLRLSPILNIYEKIEDVMQWFVTPFSIQNFQNINNKINFTCNVSSKDHPYLVSYLTAVLESLPTYSAEEKSEVTWRDRQVQVHYTPYGQLSLFLERNSEFSPDLFRKLKNSVLSLEKEYLKKRKILEEKTQQIQSFQNQKDQVLKLCDEMEQALHQIKKDQKEKSLNNKISNLYRCMGQMRDMCHGKD